MSGIKILHDWRKLRAEGVCQLCEEPAPFANKQGEPYLEVHHIEWLARGDTDTLDNTIALSPTAIGECML